MAQKVDELGRLITPLYDYYESSGTKLTDFGGWALPIQYTKIQEEHHAVRKNVGIFDVSHMGEILVTSASKSVIAWFNYLITNDANKCQVNQAQYTAVVNEQGQTLDDLIYYRLNEEQILVTPNAGNREKILAWLEAHNQDGQVKIEDQTFEYGLIAIQGPRAEAVLQQVTETDLSDIKAYHFLAEQSVAEVANVLISRTGYTGEEGFELYIPWKETANIWQKLLEVGQEANITECGLGARDTLRLEAGMPLYGNDLSEEISPIEGGLTFAIDFKKDDFIGKEALLEIKNKPNRKMSRGFELEGKGIARQGYPVFETEDSEAEIGVVTSGTKSPTFDKALGFIMIDKNYAKLDNIVYVGVRNKRIPARLTKKDWLKHK